MMSGNPANEHPLFALILCGGQSSRMGRDKGLLPLSELPSTLLEQCEFPSPLPHKGLIKRLEGKHPQLSPDSFTSAPHYFHSGITWVEHLALICACAGLPALVSINPDQWKNYAALFDESHLIKDSEILVNGPLKGLLCAHSHWPDKDFLVITCDMPLLHAKHIHLLITHYKDFVDEEKNIAFKNENIKWLPFPAIYHHKLLKLATYNFSPKYASCKKIIANNPKITHFLSEKEENHFKNFNAIRDLK